MTALPLIAVDIGNSTIKFAAPRATSISLPASRHDLRHPQWPHQVIADVQQAIAGNSALQPASGPTGTSSSAAGSNPDQRCQWLVATVNRPAATALREVLAEERPADDWRLLRREDLRISSDLLHPHTIGIDRLIGAVGGMRVTGNDQVAIVDAGSAVTVDLVRDGIFRGGAILPGLQMQFSVLNQATAQLPHIQQSPERPLEIPGQSTEAAIRCGVLMGLAGGVDRVLDHYESLCSEPLTVALTGGDASVLRAHLRHPSVYHGELLLETIAGIGQTMGVD